MNQRIQELMLEAGYAAPELAVRVQKLAELIINECMELGDKALQDGKWPGDVLKESFGVKS